VDQVPHRTMRSLFCAGKSDLDETGRQYLSHVEMQLNAKPAEYEISLPIEDVQTEFSPMLAEPLQSLTVAKGKEARFQVRLASLPPPEVMWYKDKKPLTRNGVAISSKHRFYYQTRAHSHTRGLIISPVDASDAGLYELKAWNKLGKVACSALLTVKGNKPKSKLVGR